MKAHTIAMITDFGTEDGYVGAMKGQILSDAPGTTLVDISHEIEQYNVRQAAFCLNNSYPYFPDKTIFLVVVDPGVGTSRHGIMVRSSQHYFVGPDNGVFSFITEREGYQAFLIREDELPGNITPTFHGRDIFARIAAWLAAGTAVDKYLTPLREINSFLRPPQHISESEYHLEVLHIDHFGNLILNFQRNELLALESPPSVCVNIKGHELREIRETFDDVGEGELLLNWDSSDFLQIACNKGNAAQLLAAGVGDQVQLQL